MGQISLQIPVIGVSDTTEDVKIQSDLTTIQTVINGNIDPSNLNPTGGVMSLAFRSGAANLNAAAGDWVVAAAGITVTLPAPAANAVVTVTTNGSTSGASPVTVAYGSAAIFGPGMAAGVASFLLGSPVASVALQGNGTQWIVRGGQQDTGWVALTPIAPFTGSPVARLIGSRVEFSGALSAASSQIPGTEMATIPSGPRLPGNVVKPFVCAMGAGTLVVNVNGSASGLANVLVADGSYTGGAAVDLSVISYRVD